MTGRHDILLDAVALITAAAHELSDERISDKLLDAARVIRANTLMGAFPERGTMADLNNLLTDLDIPFAVIGGVAVAIHGNERSTDDIDILVEELPDPSKIANAEYMRSFRFYKGKSHTGGHLILDHFRGQCELLPALAPWQLWALRTAQRTMVLGASVPVVRAEALVVMKLKALKRDRPSDWSDIVSVLRTNRSSIVQEDIEQWLDADELAKFTALWATLR